MRYRVKTKEEFEQEYGDRWRAQVSWNPECDWMLGKYLSDKLIERYGVALRDEICYFNVERYPGNSEEIHPTSTSSYSLGKTDLVEEEEIEF